MTSGVIARPRTTVAEEAVWHDLCPVLEALFLARAGAQIKSPRTRSAAGNAVIDPGRRWLAKAGPSDKQRQQLRLVRVADGARPPILRPGTFRSAIPRFGCTFRPQSIATVGPRPLAPCARTRRAFPAAGRLLIAVPDEG